MEKKTGSSVAKTAYGQKLANPIAYDYKWENFTGFAELEAAKQTLTEEEQVKVRNVEAQNNARAAALQVALDAAGIVKPTLDNDEQLRLREMFKVLMSSKKYTDDEARELAATTLGLSWAE